MSSSLINQLPCFQCSDNLLTDAQITLTYAEIPEIFANLTQLFARQQIKDGACFGIACENSVLSAVFLLYFAEVGYSFLPVPKNMQTGENLMLPSFCRYQLTIANKIEDSEFWHHLDRHLQIIENPAWIASSQALKPSLYLRTSGSTGSPKLVVHTHENLFKNAQNCVQRLGLQSSDRIAIPVPIYHMYGLGAAFFPSILAGASIDLQNGANLIKYLERERQFNPNIAFMTPNFCNTLVKGRRADRQYRFTVVAGDRLQEATFKQYESRFGCVVPLYGSTEMGAIAAANPSDSSELRSQSVGQPMAGVQLRISPNSVDGFSTADSLVQSGELECQHDYGFEGYINEQGNWLSEPKTVSEGWFRTQDWSQIDRQGNLKIVGRSDHSVNRDGLLVFFADIERVMLAIPGVESAVVILGGETLRGKELIAYCTVTAKQTLPETAIRNACFEHLPKRAVPDQIRILDAMPLLPSGKVDRLALPQIAIQ